MFTALLTFLGGGAFRFLMGEVMSFLKSRQEQRAEADMLRLQADLDDRRAAREAAGIRLQAELGVQTIRVQGEVDTAVEEARAFTTAMAAAQKPTGIKWVDAWNAAVRPAYATVALALWIGSIVSRGFALSEWDLAAMGAIMGFFFADRSLRKAGR